MGPSCKLKCCIMNLLGSVTLGVSCHGDSATLTPNKLTWIGAIQVAGGRHQCIMSSNELLSRSRGLYPVRTYVHVSTNASASFPISPHSFLLINTAFCNGGKLPKAPYVDRLYVRIINWFIFTHHFHIPYDAVRRNWDYTGYIGF